MTCLDDLTLMLGFIPQQRCDSCDHGTEGVDPLVLRFKDVSPMSKTESCSQKVRDNS